MVLSNDKVRKVSKAVLVNQTTGYLTIDVVNAYAGHYDDVALIAGTVSPIYARISPTVKCEKIVKYNKATIVTRIFSWLIATVQIIFKLSTKFRGYTVVYFTNPPMSYFASLILKNPFKIVIYDLYPDALANIGIASSSVIYKLWRKCNIKLFSKAEEIITIGEGMKEAVSAYVRSDKIKVVYNWPSSDDFHAVKKVDNIFIVKNRLQDKFLVQYSGNIGYTHDVECLVLVAEALRANNDIVFVFIGEGKKKACLQKLSEEKRLENCIFLPWQPEEILPYSLSAADIGVVSLNAESALVSVPSKTYNLLAAGAPLLCITPQNSELARLITEYDNGRCFNGDDIDSMANFIMTLYHDGQMRKRMSDNSIAASKHFTKANAQQYL